MYAQPMHSVNRGEKEFRTRIGSAIRPMEVCLPRRRAVPRDRQTDFKHQEMCFRKIGGYSSVGNRQGARLQIKCGC